MKVGFNNINFNQPVYSKKANYSNIKFGNNAQKIAVYAGTFDPITNGHFDLIKAGSKLFDKLIVMIGINPDKNPRFPLENRKELIKQSVKELPNVQVDYYDGLTVDYAKNHEADYLLRGMRPNLKDFEYEVRVHDTNEKIAPGIQTIYILASSINKAVSSSAIRDLIDEKNLDKIKELVPEAVYNYIVENFSKLYKGEKQ